VTGGAGYVGSVCCLQLLQRGHQVTVVDNLSTGHAAAIPQGAVLHQLDIADRGEMARVLAADRFDAVFHFAAKALIPESVSNPGTFFDSNVASGIALLETVRAAGIRKFVFSSSAAVYGNPRSIPIDEDHPKHPVNSYGETKLMLERVLHWYALAYGWTVVAFRYFNDAAPHRRSARTIARRRISFRCYSRRLRENGTSLKSTAMTIQPPTEHVCVIMFMSWT